MDLYGKKSIVLFSTRKKNQYPPVSNMAIELSDYVSSPTTL